MNLILTSPVFVRNTRLVGILFSSKGANYKTFTLRLESTVGIFKNTRTEKKKSAYKKEKGIVRDKYIPMILGGTGIVVCGIKQLCKPVDQAVGKSGVIW